MRAIKKGVATAAEKLMKTDVFAEPAAAFKVRGSDTYPSPFGTLMSLLLFGIVATYGINKFALMADREDVNFKVVTAPVDFDDDTTFA